MFLDGWMPPSALNQNIHRFSIRTSQISFTLPHLAVALSWNLFIVCRFPTLAATFAARKACVQKGFALVSYRSPFFAPQGQWEMVGGTKPVPDISKAERFQDGAKKSGGIRTTKHAAPNERAKTPSRGNREEHIQSDNARERERAKRAGSTNIDQQGNRFDRTRPDRAIVAQRKARSSQ
jgi:hypothetical protein